MSQSVLCTRRQFQNFPWEQACPNSHWVARSSEGVPRSIASDVGGTNFCGLNLMRFFSQYISTTLIFLMVEIILMFVVCWKSSNFQLSLRQLVRGTRLPSFTVMNGSLGFNETRFYTKPHPIIRTPLQRAHSGIFLWFQFLILRTKRELIN